MADAMKRVVVISLALILWAGAALAADELAAARAKAEPIAANYFDALQAGDYARMTRDFDATMKAKLTPDQLRTLHADAAKDLGAFVSAAFDRVERQGGWVLVYYRATYAKAATEAKFVFAGNDPSFKLAGLWETPAAKATTPDETAAIRAKADPVIARFFAAYKVKKYIDMTADFTDEMKQGLGPDKLRQTLETGMEKSGPFLAATFDRMQFEGPFVSVFYNAAFEKGAPVSFKFVFRKDDPSSKIGGLWVQPGAGGTK
jgi:hypothetical protein